MSLRLLTVPALFAVFLAVPVAAAETTSPPSTALDRGYRLLYNLEFTSAQQEFSAWQQQHPDDPLGPVSEAAGLLFSEFQRLGVLEAQFFENGRAFLDRQRVTPDPNLRGNFDRALDRAEALARVRLQKNTKDRDALFGMTLVFGLRADYLSLIEKRNFASLRATRQASMWADELLAVDPACYDAFLARGIGRYIVGSLVAPVRWLLRFGGLEGDKKAGLDDLQVAAERGHYLAPFARILLAIAYVRERDTAHARQILASLDQDFPKNPLFAREMARLETAP
jgi:hypothetical protein